MDSQGAVGSQDLRKDRSHAQEKQPDTNANHAQAHAQPVSHTNGTTSHGLNGVLPNGVPSASDAAPTTNGQSSTSVAVSASDQPPPLDQSWRSHDSNKSLGTLMERTAQQCYYDLNQTLRSMSEVPIEPQQHQPNGVLPHAGGQDTSDGSLEKKRMIMDFASNQRERFIKTLVLSDWCRNEEDKNRLIDVKVWQVKQREAHAGAARAVGQTKLNMIPARMPDPNLEGAMELLSTGKASWVPDLNYIPPKRLSAKQLLRTLQNMNVALATRLNLSEDLPPHFQNFSIADGRATFTVFDEFEVDLSVADEDAATPFYFIDIRFLFRPASSILDDRLRGFLEARANQELALRGLKGCYDFLHNFVLTHKINVLQSQAAELMRGKWFDCIRVEKLRRTLVVQYWCGMPGAKSWIEIGVSSGKRRNVLSRQAATPQISVRWVRKNVEMKDEPLDFDWRDLDLERCLSMVIGRHSASIMKDLQAGVCNSAPAGSSLVSEYSPPAPPLEESALLFNLPSIREPLQVRIEHVTGQVSISPPSQASRNTERRLNNDDKAVASTWLSGLLCALIQVRLRKEAELLGWVPALNLVKQTDLEALFGKGVRNHSEYIPTAAWGDRWALAITCSPGCEKWWVVSFEPKLDQQGNTIGRTIGSARRIPLIDEKLEKLTISQATLMRMEKAAMAEVAFGTLSKQLKEMRIPHSFEKLAQPVVADRPAMLASPSRFALFIRFSLLMHDSQNKNWKPWADDLLRLTHHGIAAEVEHEKGGFGNVRHDLRLSLEPAKMKGLQEHITHSKERDLLMSATGGLALRFLTPFGQPFIEQMQKRLRSVERLDAYLTLLKSRRFTCKHVSLSRLTFVYNKDPELIARIDFSNDGGLPARLKLLPADSNPHHRISVFLEKGLNETGSTGFAALLFILSLTEPVLRTLERLESIDPAKRTVTVRPRSSTWYSVTYSIPLPRCSFQLKAMTKAEGKQKSVRWHIRDTSSAIGRSIQEERPDALKEAWHSSGEHWRGVGDGIIADVQGIGDALEKVDEIVRRSEGTTQPALEERMDGIVEESLTAQPPQDSSQSVSQLQKQTAKKQPPPAIQPSKPATIAKAEPDVIMLD